MAKINSLVQIITKAIAKIDSSVQIITVAMAKMYSFVDYSSYGQDEFLPICPSYAVR